MGSLLVLTTCETVAAAEQLAGVLVEQRLAACVNALGGVSSTYRWEGRIERAQEVLLLIKTDEQHFEAIEQMIKARSSYELPEVLAVRIHNGSADYLRWLAGSLAD